jgi:hypothetical protein
MRITIRIVSCLIIAVGLIVSTVFTGLIGTTWVGTVSQAGHSAKADSATRTIDNWAEAPGGAHDCSGNFDMTHSLQTAINNVPDGGIIKFPINCKVLLSGTITISSRVGVQLISEITGGRGGCSGQPQFIWNAIGGVMVDYEFSDGPVIKGISFTAKPGKYVDTYLNFDRATSGTHAGTAGKILSSCFTYGDTNNVNFNAIYIAQKSNSNEENFTIDDIRVTCSGTQSALRSHTAEITAGSATLTSTDAKFSSRDTGQTIWVSYPGYFLKTSISVVVNSKTVQLAEPNTVSQSEATIYIGQSYGNAVHVGPSQNSMQHEFYNISGTHCDHTIWLENGGADIQHVSGGSGNYGILISNDVQGTSVTYYESEGDNRGIEILGNQTAPILLTNNRFSNFNQFADGFVRLGGRVTIMHSSITNVPSANMVLIGNGTASPGYVVSINNNWQFMTGTLLGLGQFTTPQITSIFDLIDDSSPTTNFSCFSGGKACVGITGTFGHVDGASALAIAPQSLYADKKPSSILESLSTPSSSSEPCTQGQRKQDASYIYVCTATNTWKRAALSAF